MKTTTLCFFLTLLGLIAMTTATTTMAPTTMGPSEGPSTDDGSGSVTVQMSVFLMVATILCQFFMR